MTTPKQLWYALNFWGFIILGQNVTTGMLAVICFAAAILNLIGFYFDKRP